MRRARLAVAIGAIVLAIVAVRSWQRADRAAVLVADAAFPAAMAALPDGGLIYGERLTGRVVRVHRDGSKEVVGAVDVSTHGEQRGLVGVAIRGDQVFVSFTDPLGRLRVSSLEGTTVWLGPQSADRANGGRIAFAPDGSLVIGIGTLLDPRAAADPDTPNGKMLRLDPDGPPDQHPIVISAGWNNPFAFTFVADGTLVVADNAGGDAPERLAVADAGDEPTTLTTLPPHSVPSGLAPIGDDRLALCTYLDRTLYSYRVDAQEAWRDPDPLAQDCSIGVIALQDGALAYADERSIRRVEP